MGGIWSCSGLRFCPLSTAPGRRVGVQVIESGIYGIPPSSMLHRGSIDSANFQRVQSAV